MSTDHREGGFTLAETAVTILIGSVVLVLAATLLVSASRSGVLTQGQAFTLNDARNAMQQIEREVRGADFINWCVPAGSCLEIGAQTPTAGFQTVRYRHTDRTLTRQIYDPATSAWTDPQTVVNRLANAGEAPVFACDTQSTLLRVNVDLRIEPTPVSNPVLNMTTTVRPRNFPSKASCPSL